MNIRIKRAYAPADLADGYRVLIDGLWPRGVSKADIRIDEWFKECAPSPDLRKWFNHDPGKWRQFERRYTNELETKREEVVGLIERAGRQCITLVYGAKNEQHNHAIVLKAFMERRSTNRRP